MVLIAQIRASTKISEDANIRPIGSILLIKLIQIITKSCGEPLTGCETENWLPQENLTVGIRAVQARLIRLSKTFWRLFFNQERAQCGTRYNLINSGEKQVLVSF